MKNVYKMLTGIMLCSLMMACGNSTKDVDDNEGSEEQTSNVSSKKQQNNLDLIELRQLNDLMGKFNQTKNEIAKINETANPSAHRARLNELQQTLEAYGDEIKRLSLSLESRLYEMEKQSDDPQTQELIEQARHQAEEYRYRVYNVLY